MQGAGYRVQRAPTALMAKTKACLGAQPPFELHFLSFSPAAEHAKPLSGDLAMSVLLPVKAQGWVGKEEEDQTSVLCCMCNCVPVCVCVCQFSQLTATVAEPRTLDSINCTCQTDEIINAIAAASAAHYCN